MLELPLAWEPRRLQTLVVIRRTQPGAPTCPPADSDPDAGCLIGVAIRHVATTEGTAEAREAVATLEAGVKAVSGIEADPDGLIHHEEVFHSARAVLATLRSADI